MQRQQLLFNPVPVRRRRSGRVVSQALGLWWFEQIRKEIKKACDNAQRGTPVQPELPLK